MRMIDERPAEVADRAQAGHWEGDLIMGAGNRTAIGTLVERSTRFLILLAFPDAVGSAEAVREAISTALERLPEGLRRTLTWDQGKELALHQQVATATGAGVFFCEAHSPWQIGRVLARHVRGRAGVRWSRRLAQPESRSVTRP